jgi:hypothetical protein
MRDSESSTSSVLTRSPLFPIAVAVLLIGSFCYRAFTAAHEYPMRTEQVMTIAFDFLLVVGLIAMRARLAKPLFWIALFAGLGLFAIRMNSDASWWTGHIAYSLSPR